MCKILNMYKILKSLISMMIMAMIIAPSYAQDSQNSSDAPKEDLHQSWLDTSLAQLNLSAGKQWKAPTNCTLPFDALLAEDDNIILVDCQFLRAAKTQKETQAILIVLAAQHLDKQRPFYQKPSAIEQIAGTAAQIVASDPDETQSGLGSAFRETEFKKARQDDGNHVAARSTFWMQQSGVCTGALENYLSHVQNDNDVAAGTMLRLWAKNVRLQMGSALYNPDNSCLEE